MRWSKLLGLATLPALVYAYASTDSIQDVDPAQSGYLPNHNMDPNVVGGSTFGISWKNKYNTAEVFYAKPLVYTPSGFANEQLIAVSNQNIIRIIDGLNGTLVNSRTLDPPFRAIDTAGCGDIPNTVGITGTPIIDPATSIMYFFSKGYKGAAVGPAGTLNGQYKFYAVQIPTLQDVPGFPVIIDGNFADNDPTRYFVGGTVLQRPALTSLGNIVVGGFGGHCDNFNYTGMLVSVSKTSGVGVTNIYAMEASPGAPSPQALVYTNQNGGKAGIWQTGMGFPTVGNQIYFVTGNGEGAINGVPASGRIPLSTLDNCLANFAVDPSTGVFSQTDYFEPYEYSSLDGSDRDFGSSGSCLLDPTTFSGTGVDRMIVAGGKTGKVYVLNADNLGGFAQGPGGTDNVIQTIINGSPMFSGVGSYPLDGGYFYYNPSGDLVYAYKMGVDSTGRPLFTLAGKTSAPYAGHSVPTVTSLNGQPGTGIVWMSDSNKGLVAFKAVPSGGILQPISLPATGGLTKYQRPVFGNGRVYVISANTIIALGTPVTLPLSCAGPVDFGSVNVGQTTTVQINCTALSAVTINGCTTSVSMFQCQNSSLPSAVASGGSFTFPVTWNVTQAAINQAESNGHFQVLPGIESAALNLYATAGVAGYAADTPIQLLGTVVAPQGYLVINSSEVDFGGIVLGGSVSQLSSSVILQNQGTSVLTFSGFAWQDMYANGQPFNNVSVLPSNQPTIVGNDFTSTNFPNVGTQLSPGQSITIPLSFSANTTGTWASFLTFWSDGGSADVLMTGAAANGPIANLSISDGQGNWISSPLNMAFGNVSSGASVERQIRLCNNGASALAITLSQPPVGADLTALNPILELRQGTTVDVGACSYGTVVVIAPPLQPNHPSIPLSGQWVIGTNGNNPNGTAFGSQTITINATVVGRQVGPLEASGQGIYQFLGCYLDSAGRNLNALTVITNNSIEACMTYCYGAGYAIAGTEYHTQCWCGNTISHPSSLSPEVDCNFPCPGDATESCGGGGNGGGIGFLYAFYNQNVINPVTILSSTTSMSSTTSSSSSSSSFSTTSSSSSSTSSSPSSSSSSSTTSSKTATSTTSTTSSTSFTGPSSTSVTTTSSSTTFVTSTSTMSTVTPTSSAYQYMGCYSDITTGHALPLLFTNNSVTPELCAAYVRSLANKPTPTVLPYFYLEYHNQCYGGSVFNFGTSAVTSLSGAHACTDVCSGSIGASTTGTAFCGGAFQFNLYALNGVVSWPTQTSSSSSSSSSFSSSSTTSSTSSSSTSSTSSSSSSPFTSTTSTTSTSSSTFTGPSSTSVTTTTSSSTTFVTSTSTMSTVTPTSSAYQYMGCYSDITIGHALPLLFTNNSVTPELCAAYVRSLANKPTPTVLPYFYLEYHNECYGGSVFNFGTSSVTSLSGAHACTDVCSGSIGASTTGTAFCGGAFQFNLYALNGVVSWPTQTSSSSSSSSVSSTASSSSSSSSSSTTSSSSSSISSTSSSSSSSSSSSTIATPTPSATYNWNIGWVSAAPDGFTRPFVGINGQWPCPAIEVNVGDIIQLNVYNGLGNETTAIHFHGISQRGTNEMDGPAMVTQCSIPPGGTFVYEFQINQTGTYWYHAHVGGQYMDGFRGPLIVHDPAAPFYNQINEEIVMTVSDLYHNQAPYLINYYQSPTNEDLNGGAEPVPNATLINEAQNVSFSITPGNTYLFRIINMGVFAAQWLQFDQHEMTVVEVDGVYTQPYIVNQLFITVAQRYSVIVTAKADNSRNFAILASMDTDMFYEGVTPPNLQNNVTSWLVYDPTKPLPPPFDMQLQPFDDTVFLPYDQQPLLGPVTYSLSLAADFGPNDQNQQRAMFNGISYVPQLVPTLYTALSAPAGLVDNPTIYGVNSNPYVIPYGSVVELTIVNHDSGAHPFHLHGHNFQVVDRSGGGLFFPGVSSPDPPIPMRRDVLIVYAGGYAVIRFVADNPGITLFHCHIEWHVEGGLTATFIEAPDQLQAMNLNIPDTHKAVCAAKGIPMIGNAAGNSANWLNLTGANTEPPLNAWGALVNPPS